MGKLKLSEENRKEFEELFKIGMLKQLHKEGMLSDAQLIKGISMIRAKNSCTSRKAAV